MQSIRGLAVFLLVAALLVLMTNTNMHAAIEALKLLGTASAQQTLPARVRPRTLPPGSAVLVTGGAGFVGYHLCLRLRRSGVRVVALDNFDPYYSTALKRARQERLKSAGIQVVEGDMCDEQRLSQLLLDDASFTHVASMAAQAGVRYSLIRPQAYVRANVQCFLTLLEVLRQRPSVRLVYASSSSVYGANTKAPFSEDDRTDSPNSLYAATKKTNEQLAHVYHGLYGLHVTGLRFFTVYGPWGRPDMAYFSFAHRISTGQPIEVYGHGKPQRDFTYIDDVVEGVVGALALGADEEIFNLGNHRTEPLGRFISVLEAELGQRANKTEVGMAPGDVLATYADVQRATERIGYTPRTSIDEGLRKFVQWYRSPDFRVEYAEQGEWKSAKRHDHRPLLSIKY
jgi:UDP-glucuronate 4-epimerase